MDKYLFRGKRASDGAWLYGDLFHTRRRNVVECCIHSSKYCFQVDKTTVGQYTGLKDKDGKQIFEGDIFQVDDDLVSVVIFKDGCFRFETWGLRGTYTESGYDECGGGWGVVDCEPIDWYYVSDMEVVGNIHDKPELLEVLK